MKTRLSILLFLFIFLFFTPVFLTACGTPEGNNNNNSQNNNNNNNKQTKETPELKEGWQEIKPGGDTVCSRGTPYSFFARKGSTNNLVIDFQGGGACWSAETCALKGAIFQEDVSDLREIIMNSNDPKVRAKYGGLYDVENKENPFKEWFHVTIPYCTGDIHWGNNKVKYTPKDKKLEAFEVNHKGGSNAKSVLDWIFKNFKSPKKIFVTGCSAGSYGSIIWSSHIAKHYKDAKIYHMGDCGAGIITDDFLKNSFPQWKAEFSMPSWIPTLDPAKVQIEDKDLGYLYVSIANHYKNITFSQYNTYQDENQVFYFKAMGAGDPKLWTKRMLESMENIKKSAPNFRSYVAPGKKHCIIPYPEFYKVTSNGVRLVDWIKNMIDGKEVKNVKCKEENCAPK